MTPLQWTQVLQKLIYLIYIIAPVLLLIGSKKISKGVWNDGFLSLDQSKAYQGFLAFCIMLHHIGQKTCASWIYPQSRVVHGLDFFVPIGYIMVAMFLFYNGYGSGLSVATKKDYLKGYPVKRILPLVFYYYLMQVIYTIARYLIGQRIDGKQLAYYLSGAQLSNPNAWYVIMLPFFYLAFYFAFRFIKKEGAAIAVVFICFLVYIIAGTFIDHNSWWVCGEWWYNSAILFPIGLLFAKHKEKIIGHLRRHYKLYLCLTIVLLYPLFAVSEIAQGVFSYYGETWGAPDKVFRRQICLLSQILVSLDFVLLSLLLGMKVRIGNRFLKFMGGITLEFYLIHGLFVELFNYEFDGGARSPFTIKIVILYVLAVFVLAVPSALLVKLAGNGFRKLTGRNKK